jgi:hypothetical protein
MYVPTEKKKLPKPYEYSIPTDQNKNYWKRPFFVPVPFKINKKNEVYTCTIALSPHTHYKV